LGLETALNLLSKLYAEALSREVGRQRQRNSRAANLATVLGVDRAPIFVTADAHDGITLPAIDFKSVAEVLAKLGQTLPAYETACA
jgi:hypothetical protein